MTISSHVLTTWEEFEGLSDQWDKLLLQSDADAIFLRWDWINSWRHTAAITIKPYIIILKDERGIIAIAPFYQQTYQLFKGIPYQALKFAGDQGIGSEYSNFIAHKSASSALKKRLWQTLLAQKTHWDFIWLTNIAQWTEGGQNLLASLNEITALQHYQREISFASTPLNTINGDILPCLSKSLRTNIKQTQKYLSREGQWKVTETKEKSQLNNDLQSLFSLHNKRWQKTGLSGSFERRPAMASFYQHFALRALEQGWLRLLKLEVEGEVQAMQIGYVYKQQFLAIQEGFNPDFLAGTGQVLRYFSFQKCLEEKIEHYDFLGMYTDHKRRWLAEKRQGCHLFIYTDKIKNLPFKFKKIWPTGQYLNEITK